MPISSCPSSMPCSPKRGLHWVISTASPSGAGRARSPGCGSLPGWCRDSRTRAGLRVVPVSSLAAVAARVPAAAGETVLVCNDARMGELYWGHYALGTDGAVVALGAERVGPPDSVIALSEARHVAGNGLARHAGLRTALAAQGLRVHEGLYPRADAVVRLGAAGFVAGLSVGPEEALPIYVRDEVAAVRAATVTPLQ